MVVIFSGENNPAVYASLEKTVEDALHSAEAADATKLQPKSSAPAASATPTFTAKIDGQSWSADNVISTYTTIGGRPVFNMSARSTGKTTSFFSFNLYEGPDKSLSASIPLMNGKPPETSHATYNADALSGDAFGNNFVFDKGAVTITSDDQKLKILAGDFSGTAHNQAGKTISITAGHFAGVPFDPAQSK